MKKEVETGCTEGLYYKKEEINGGTGEGKQGQERFLLVCFKDGRKYSVTARWQGSVMMQKRRDSTRCDGGSLEKFRSACLSFLSEMENGQQLREECRKMSEAFKEGRKGRK